MSVALQLETGEAPVSLESTKPEVPLVIPGLNEALSLPLLADQVHEALGGTTQYEIIFVDDGSTDDSWRVITDLHQRNSAIRGVRLRRNFGKATALAAGFERARADIVIMMDADLQDDPANLPDMIRGIESGLDVVVGWKVNRRDPFNRRMLSLIFNRAVAARCSRSALSMSLRFADAGASIHPYREGSVSEGCTGSSHS
jgi:glycosyltransferase involved in cell wall biosynthesis